jgi:hypothetical protein
MACLEDPPLSFSAAIALPTISLSFKIGEVVKPKTKPAAKPKKVVKPKAAKPKIAKTPKKTAAKKPAEL